MNGLAQKTEKLRKCNYLTIRIHLDSPLLKRKKKVILKGIFFQPVTSKYEKKSIISLTLSQH